MARHTILTVVVTLAIGALAAACSSDDSQPAPGGINAPARVDPDANANNSGD